MAVQECHAIDCSTALRSESKGQQIVGLGLDDIIAIAMSDAVLIANKDRAQDVKSVVDNLKSNDISQEEILPDFRLGVGLKALFSLKNFRSNAFVLKLEQLLVCKVIAIAQSIGL